jgi:hypothetical protein
VIAELFERVDCQRSDENLVLYQQGFAFGRQAAPLLNGCVSQ